MKNWRLLECDNQPSDLASFQIQATEDRSSDGLLKIQDMKETICGIQLKEFQHVEFLTN